MLLHLAPLDLTFIKEENRVVVHESGTKKDINITLSGDFDFVYIDYRPAVDENAQFTYAPVVVARKVGESLELCTKITFEA